ncbi:Type IV secretory system Conjugative DNA transfer [compost metagenome]
MGTTTVRVKNLSVNMGEKRSKTDSYVEQPRALLMPQEVNELPYDEELIFVQGTKKTPPINIRARKIFWYEEPVFKARANLPTPALPIGDASKIDALTVPIRTVEPKSAVRAPHDQQLREEQQKRSAPPV